MEPTPYHKRFEENDPTIHRMIEYINAANEALLASKINPSEETRVWFLKNYYAAYNVDTGRFVAQPYYYTTVSAMYGSSTSIPDWRQNEDVCRDLL